MIFHSKKKKLEKMDDCILLNEILVLDESVYEIGNLSILLKLDLINSRFSLFFFFFYKIFSQFF